jgi:isochorismate pyruvate lyase
MTGIGECQSLDEVRANINRIDEAPVRLLAERGGYVRHAARFKQTTDDVRAPARVEQVIGKVRALADEHGASPDLVERVHRTLIAAFIDEELQEHGRRP